MCSNCKVTYYGKTYRHFFTRAAEHMGISNLTGKRLKCVKQSAVSDHLLECNCSIDFNHFDILASDVNKFRLLIKESVLIKRDQPQLNKTGGVSHALLPKLKQSALILEKKCTDIFFYGLNSSFKILL